MFGLGRVVVLLTGSVSLGNLVALGANLVVTAVVLLMLRQPRVTEPQTHE